MAEKTRDRLVNTASSLFYEHGFHAVGLDRILDGVGITKTAFYKHFESKDALIIEVLSRRDAAETAEWTAIMRERGGDDPRAQILALFDLLDEWFRQETFRGCMFISAAVAFPGPHDPIHVAAARHGAGLHEELRRLAKAAGAAHPELPARQVLLLVSGAIVARHVGLDGSAARTAQATAEMILDQHLGPSAPNGRA